MKPLPLVASVLFLAVGLIAAEANEWQGKKVPQLVLANGKTYTGVTFTKVEAAAITITHAGGILRIPMESLKPEAQAALGYDPAKAAAARKLADETRQREAAKSLADAAANVPERNASIPGIAAVDLHGNLEKLGFQTKRISHDGEMLWTSKAEDGSASLSGEAFGNGPTRITSIRGTAIVYDPSQLEAVASEFLAYIASIPYDDADPVAAGNWVRQNIARNSKTVINGVQFEIFANAPAVRMLRITPAP